MSAPVSGLRAASRPSSDESNGQAGSTPSLSPQALRRLDLACGQNKQEGFLGIDICDVEGVDLVYDLTKFPWPIQDNVTEEVFCSHYVEHTPDLIKFMNEVHRICKDGAEVKIVHPYLKSDRAFQDPTHTRFIPDATWWYFSKEWRVSQKLDHYPITCDFDVVNITAAFNPPWHMRSEETKQFAGQHYWNVISDLIVLLKVKKDE